MISILIITAATTLTLMTPGVSGQDSSEWGLEGKPENLDSLVKFIYDGRSGQWDLADLNLTEIQDSIHEKLSTLNLTSADLDTFLNFDDVGLTPLGQLTGWFGDKVYPVIVYVLIFGGIAIVLYIFAQVRKLSSCRFFISAKLTDIC